MVLPAWALCRRVRRRVVWVACRGYMHISSGHAYFTASVHGRTARLCFFAGRGWGDGGGPPRETCLSIRFDSRDLNESLKVVMHVGLPVIMYQGQYAGSFIVVMYSLLYMHSTFLSHVG